MSDTVPMMTEQPVHATVSPGAEMDRKVERRRAPLWRRPAVLAIAGGAVAAVLLWRLLPASGSTDIASVSYTHLTLPTKA